MWITPERYDSLVQQYKEEQHDINARLQKFDQADKSFYITANQVISLAERALEIFESSEAFEKKQLVNFLLLNLKLDGKKLLFDIREPFAELVSAKSTNQWGESWELNP